MNILFVFYVPSGGVETLNRQRCAALKKYGIQAHCLYYENRRAMMNDHGTTTFVTNKDAEIKHILDQGKYDAIVIVSDFQALPRFRALGYQGPMIMEIQGYGPKHVARAAFINAKPLVHSHAAAFLNPRTPHIMQLLDEIYPAIPKFSFNNCFNTNDFTYIRQAPSPRPILAWIGRIEDNKNWREFLQIGHRMIQQHDPNLLLFMFEDPTISIASERNQFYQLQSELQLKDHLTILPNVPNSQMVEYYSMIGDSGGLLCSTSKVEGAPYSILEAMSCRCPILTTDSDGVRSSVIHNQTGKYYTLGNIDEAVREAKELMTSASLREHIRQTAQRHVQTDFHPDRYCQHFLRMLSALGLKSH